MIEEFYQIAVDAPIDQTLTYKSDLSGVLIGQIVTVPLRNKPTRGVILNQAPPPTESKYEIKKIEKIHSEFPRLSEAYIKWIHWLSNYYLYPLGQIAPLCLPPLEKKEGRSRKSPITPALEKKERPLLSNEQQAVVDNILKDTSFKTHLIWGVTGSGKTEVYLELLEKHLGQDDQALILVPEISLTPQLIRRFSERLGDQVAVLHSHLTPREKTNQWWSVVEGNKKVLIGARSALFCPFKKLSLIIVDEEHEPSFKQDEQLKYNARDSAIVLAQMLNIPICLGSATPSLESWKNAIEGKYELHKLTQRFGDLELPNVDVVDLRDKDKEKQERLNLPDWISPLLYEKTVDRLSKKQQVAFFLNRRGMAKTVLCRTCGLVKLCPNCDISLTLHGKSHLVCHYCDYSETLSEKCDHCRVGEFSAIGTGTEKIEQDLSRLFPDAKTIRLDRDEISDRDSLTLAIEKIERREVDIIIGTQMIAKGLDFKNLTLLGIILADVGFNIPDFRTGERSFQLLTQVSGRPGRHVVRGDVVVQTFNPDHPSLLYSKTHDFLGFAEQELKFREELSYPPYGRMACIRFQGLSLEKVKLASRKILARGEALISKHPKQFGEILILGPAPASMAKLKNKYRYNMILKSKSSPALRALIKELDRETKDFPAVKIVFDIDPMNTL